MVKFERFTQEDMAKDPAEFFNTIPMDEIIDMKDAPYEDKVNFMRYCMGFTDLINSSVLTNIAMLVFGTKIDDDAFDDPHVLFSSLEEYVDAKFDLKKEIFDYGGELLKYYLAALKSYTIILPDGKNPIPSSYKAILIACSMKDVSKLMGTHGFDTQTLPLVFSAEEVVDSFIFADSKPIQDFVAFVMDGLKKQ